MTDDLSPEFAACWKAASGLAWLPADVWWDLAGHFTCSEAEVIAEFLVAWCGEARGEEFLRQHALSDDEDDDHFHLRDEEPSA